ncbi:hypothetical protein [Oceanospirillum sediminis]|uniref:Uncharacterized protein n=1 Tax=Oceanospirillum sediminis TaxID=2760088 RepID=A0A839IMU1_9GAMM|nr:hypothetical protein [Oceanospirillum sediminis]MBB1485819.1 hypothetical protein [Oceanospirillum sediminis]
MTRFVPESAQGSSLKHPPSERSPFQNSGPMAFSLPHAVIIAGAGLGSHFQHELLLQLAAMQIGLFALFSLGILLIPMKYLCKHLDQPFTQADRSDWTILTVMVLLLLEWYVGVAVMVFSVIAGFILKGTLSHAMKPRLKENWLEDSLKTSSNRQSDSDSDAAQ